MQWVIKLINKHISDFISNDSTEGCFYWKFKQLSLQYVWVNL